MLIVIRAKNGNLIFNDISDLNKEIQRRIQPKIDKAIEEYHEKYNAAVEQAKTDATKEALALILPMTCNALYEVYGFGEKRLEQFIDKFMVHMSCLEQGVTDLSDYKEWCKDQGYSFIEVVNIEIEE